MDPTTSLPPMFLNVLPRGVSVFGSIRPESHVSWPRARLRGPERESRTLAITDMGVGDHRLLVRANKAIEFGRLGRGRQKQRSDDLGARDSYPRVIEPLNEGIETLRDHIRQHERPVP